jgi:replicative DNA helicase
MTATAKEPSFIRLPPQNIDAEASLLSAILHNDEALLIAQEKVRPEDFYVDAHRKIYQAMLALFEKSEAVDIVTVSNWLEQKNLLEGIGGSAFLAKIIHEVPLAVNPASYAKIVKEKAVLRLLIEKASSIAQRCYDDNEDVSEVVDFAEQEIFAVSSEKGSAAYFGLSELLNDTFLSIESRSRDRSPVTGVPTGFNRLDMLTSGFQPTDLLILAARPGMGKTALALNIAKHAATKENLPVLVFSLEMSKEQLVTRVLCSEAKVNAKRVRDGFLGADELQRLADASDRIHNAPLYIDDSGKLTVMDVRTKARRMKKDKGLGLIVIDYLQLMTGPKDAERRDLELSYISRSLKSLAKELHVPVLALSQLNRKLEDRGDKHPQLSDLRESGALEQDADVIMFIYRESVYSQMENNPDQSAELKVAKQRNGPTGKVLLTFVAEHTSFENADTIYAAN